MDGFMRIQANGAEVDITRMGDQGRGLLLLHGWGCSAEMMQGIQTRFSHNMRTVAIDFPGHGHNGKAPAPPEPWGVSDYAEMVKEVIAACSIAPCDIIAHSFGCRVALLLAASSPSLVGRMILTGAAGIRKPVSETDQRKTKAYRKARKALDFLEEKKWLGKWPEKWKEDLVQRFGSADYRALTPEMRQTFNKVITQDLTDILSSVKAPTLLFWGADDTETPLWMGRRMEELIPDAGLVIEEGAGHFAFLERQNVFLTIAEHFLLEGRDT